MAKLSDAYSQLNDEQRNVFESLRPSRGELQGMYSTLFNHPELAETLSKLGTYLRYQGALSPYDTEIAILTTAREMSALFIWQQHLKPAKAAGVEQRLIQKVQKRAPSSAVTPNRQSQLIVEIARFAARAERIPVDIANEAIKSLGKPGLIEIVVIAGFYRMIVTVVNGFDISLPELEQAVI